MRQTPFGVWNAPVRPALASASPGSNEADAFRRLELDALALDYDNGIEAPIRQTPFGVWNHTPTRTIRFGNRKAPMRQTPFGVWNQRRDAQLRARQGELQ